ncbi:hypothetical protein J7E62_02780 [Variovorax paradoxus]|nr:hypothetical protein [Variovorax paradoxus]
MAYTTASANALLKLILQAVAIAGLADNAAAAPLANLYLGLYTAAPGAGANQLTNEIAYAEYVRVAIPRSAAGWVVTGAEAALVNAVEYLEMLGTIGGGTVTHLGLGTAQTGAGLLLVHGPLDPVIPVQKGVVPRLKATTKTQFSVV